MRPVVHPHEWRGFLILIASGTPLAGLAQITEPYANFYIEPSEPGLAAGVGEPGDRFTFSADVSAARCFELDLGNGDSPLRAAAEDGKATFTHTYTAARTYPAVLWAYREQDCDAATLQKEADQVRLELDVLVRQPAAVVNSPPTFARFSVSPATSPGASAWRDFVFSANVSGATSYDLDFGDGNEAVGLRPDRRGAAIVRSHRYNKADDYDAVLRAVRSTGEIVEITQLVSVRRPGGASVSQSAAPASGRRMQAVQWPPHDAELPEVPPEEEFDALFLLLILAGTMAALGLLQPGVPATDVVKFVPAIDRGRFASRDKAGLVSSLLVRWRSPARFALSNTASAKQAGRFKLGKSKWR